MISLSIRRTLCAPESEVDRVPGVSIPDWDDVPGVRLLRALDYYEDAAFNHHLLADLIAELELWQQFEASRGDPESRVNMIGNIRQTLTSAVAGRRYAVFLSL